MNRGVITISENGTVSMPTDTVWMTMQEIADMYNVFGCYVRKAVKAVFKDGILKEQGVRRHVRKNDRISYDVYSLELSAPNRVSLEKPFSENSLSVDGSLENSAFADSVDNDNSTESRFVGYNLVKEDEFDE